MHTGVDPSGSVPRLDRIGLANTQDHCYPMQFSSSICTSLGQIA